MREVLYWPNWPSFQSRAKREHIGYKPESSFKSKHLNRFDHSKILSSVLFYNSPVIHEALEIEKNPNNFNKDDGYKINQSWKPLIHHIFH